MKKLLVAALATLAQSLVSATVATGPYIEISVGDGSVRTIVPVPGDGSVRVVNNGDVETWYVADFKIGDDSFDDLVFSFDPDPFIAFSVGITKVSAGSTTYSILFGSPYVGGPYDQVSSQLQGTLDATGTSATMTSITHTTIVDATMVLTDLMDPCSSSGPLVTCAATTAATSYASNASGFFTSSLSFTLDAPAIATFNGRSDVFASTPVPTPATLPLALLALSGLGWTLRQRRAAPRH